MGYIRGRLNIACCNLMDELQDKGVCAAVGHFGSSKKGLIVRPRSRKFLDLIPTEYEGMPVVVEWEMDDGTVKTEVR